MANSLDTDEGTNTQDSRNSSDLVQWLKSNNLKKLIPLFANEEMTLDELISFSDNEEYFKNYLTELNISKASQWRILSSIKTTKQARIRQNNQEHKMYDSKNNDDNDINQHTISRIRVTDEEDEAINKLEKYNENLLSLIKELTTLNNSVIHNEQESKSKINAQFNKLINIINNKQEQVLKELEQLSKQKSMEINTKIKEIEEKQKQAENAKLICYTTIENSNIDREQRKKTIISTANNIISEKVSSTITDVNTQFVINFNETIIQTFVENLVDINDESKEEEIRLLELQKDEKAKEQIELKLQQVDKPEKIPTSQVTQAFQACLSSKRPQQQQIADNFYADINKWCTEQLDVAGITIIVNFLFWYYRSANAPDGKFYSGQAEHIRYWADYPITNDIKWDYYNIKFDYIYSTAKLQKSIPHMKKFYRDINKETPRAIPESAKSRKPNYYLTKYQAACVLGDWTGGVKQVGDIIRDISSKATSSTATRNDYFMHYTLRALEMPAFNPNFGLIYKIVDKLINEFPLSLLPPPIFANWNILSFKYKNVENNISYLTDQQFIFASDKIKDNDGYYVFYPQASALVSRVNKKINIWGRVCQIVSPVFGAAGFLPLTGGWSDTKLYLETNWTFRGSGNRLTRKHVIMRVERMPFEEEVESKNYFGQKQNDKGYIWKGYITIHMKKLKKGLTIKDIYDEQGEDYFDGEKAIKQKKESENNDNKNESEKKIETVNNDDTMQQTQIYEVELIINTDDSSGKDKELREKILAAVNTDTNSNSATQENNENDDTSNNTAVKPKSWNLHYRNSKDDETKKIVKTFTEKSIDVHLAMETTDGFNACVAADRRNDRARLKYGAQLYKINKTKTIGLSYESIIDTLQNTKTPITLQFYQRDELCAQWTKAFKLKEESNIQYKSNKISEAIKTLSEAILLHPTNKIFHANRVLMALKRKDLTLAMNDCRTIRELDPKSLYVKGDYLRGLVLMQMKQYEAAAAAFQTVIKLNGGLQKRGQERLDECVKIVFGNTMIIEKYHFVDEKTRNLVNGFISNCQRMFDERNSNSNIDFGIYKIVAIFLYIYDANITEKQREKWMEKCANQKNEQT